MGLGQFLDRKKESPVWRSGGKTVRLSTRNAGQAFFLGRAARFAIFEVKSGEKIERAEPLSGVPPLDRLIIRPAPFLVCPPPVLRFVAANL